MQQETASCKLEPDTETATKMETETETAAVFGAETMVLAGQQ